MTLIPIVILAAGASSRMGGQDKLMLDVGGEPLLRRCVRRALAAARGPVLVALPPAPHPRYGILDGLDVTRVEASEASEGMNASLRAALRHLPDGAQAVMILLADLPDLTEDDIKSVLQCVDKNGHHLIWRGATDGGEPGHPVVFSADLIPELVQLSGDSGAQEVVRRHAHRVRLVRLPGQNARADLDTPEAWDKWRRSHTL